jgi:hypothetical protein
MEYSKEMLINEALKRLDTIDEDIVSCHNLINGIHTEKEIARYLLFLGIEKKNKNNESLSIQQT